MADHSPLKTNIRILANNGTDTAPDGSAVEPATNETVSQALRDLANTGQVIEPNGHEVTTEGTASAPETAEGGVVANQIVNAVQNAVQHIQEHTAPVLARAPLRRMQQQQAADTVRGLIAENDQQLQMLEDIVEAGRNSLNAQRSDLLEELALLEDGLGVVNAHRG